MAPLPMSFSPAVTLTLRCSRRHSFRAARSWLRASTGGAGESRGESWGSGTAADQKKAVESMNNYELHGLAITVCEYAQAATLRFRALPGEGDTSLLEESDDGNRGGGEFDDCNADEDWGATKPTRTAMAPGELAALMAVRMTTLPVLRAISHARP